MTGNPTAYDDEAYMSLLVALAQGFASWRGDHGRMTITADIEWAGEFNHRRHRTTTFFAYRQLSLARIRDLTAVAMTAREAARKIFAVPEPKGPPPTFRGRQTWLLNTAGGRAAAQRAGFTPSARTQRRWAAGTQKPSKRYAEALERAVTDRQNERVAVWRGRRSTAESGYTRAAKAAVDALTAEIGEPVRFFNVSDLYFG